jgi:glycosyltransferase involved in cell wall biosynthesis
MGRQCVFSSTGMRILHISDCYLPRLGGIEAQVHGLARRQLLAGHDVEVVTATPRSRHDRTVHEVIDGLRLYRTAVDLPYELPVHPRAGREVRRVLTGALDGSGGYDVVHAHVGVVSPFAYAACPVVIAEDLPLAVTVHSVWGPAAHALRLLDLISHWSRWPAAFSAVSDVAARPVRGVAGPGVRVDVLPNGIDEAVWRVDRASPQGDEVVIVAAMRLAPRKRPVPLLRMLREVRRAVPPDVRVRAKIIGSGPERERMARWLTRHAMDSWVELAGRLERDALRDVYRTADIFVAPARLESFGIAALEARTAGLPVVAMARAGIGEFIRPGVEGLLADDDTGMAQALVRLVVDRALRTGIATHNRRVPPAMTWPQVLKECDALYRRAGEMARRHV